MHRNFWPFFLAALLLGGFPKKLLGAILGDLRHLFFLAKIFLEQVDDLRMAHKARAGDHAAVVSYLVVLHFGDRRVNQGIAGCVGLGLFYVVLSLLHQALGGFTRLPVRLLAELLKGPLEVIDLLLGLPDVVLDSIL